MKIEIIEGPPHLTHWVSPRDQQIFDYCALSGQVWTAWVDDKLVCCWGAIPPSFMSDTAYLWMLDLPIRHPLVVARHSRQVIKALLDRWDTLAGHCHVGAEDSCKWLKWLGAEFGPPQKSLVPFEIRRP
jgi:hypothetical protein